jgi:hypothetical protein
VSSQRKLIYALLAAGVACITVGVMTTFFKSSTQQPLPPPESSPQPTQQGVQQQPTPTQSQLASNFPADVALPRNGDGSISFPASDAGWHPIGQGRFSLRIAGWIDYGGQQATPDGSGLTAKETDSPRAKAPGIDLGVLIAKIGPTGQPFKVGSYREFNSGTETVYIAINDSYYGDNTGAYTIYKR